jgi:hypothetical protein
MYSGAYNLIVIIFNRFNPGTAFIGFYNNNSVAPCQDIIFLMTMLEVILTQRSRRTQRNKLIFYRDLPLCLCVSV